MNDDKIIADWNNQADEYNQWEDLGTDEKLEFTVLYLKKEIEKLERKNKELQYVIDCMRGKPNE
jgi:hypothetical protein